MSFGRHTLNRRALFTSALAAGTALALSACSENDELADQAGSDQGTSPVRESSRRWRPRTAANPSN